MPIKSPITLPAAADMHVHLRQSPAMLSAAVPCVRAGGADTAYVMPNLIPPLTTVAAALSYREALRAVDPSVTYLMTLYLHPEVTAAVVAEAAATGGAVRGIKAYPAGVTTNSAAGVVDLRAYWPVFAAMEEAGLVLNLHGEVPGGAAEGVSVLDAEHRFLPTLRDIHAAFPRLRVVLEHCTSEAALRAVAECGDTVACTVTAHHMWLTADAWRGAGDGEVPAPGRAHNWCKPAAKTEADRAALVRAAVRGGPRVMFGSDSAPHPAAAKLTGAPAAGCFTQGWATQLVVGALEEGVRRGWIAADEVNEATLAAFMGGNARRFYGLDEPKGRIVLERKGERIPETVRGQAEGEEVEVVPFRAGEEVWSLRWE